MMQTIDRPTADTTIAIVDPVAEAITEQRPQGIERVMLAENKLPVVLVVVLIIWLGLLALVFRTDRRLARVERQLGKREGQG